MATDVGVGYINIEFICSDKDEHRNRIETRKSTIPGQKLPTWGMVESREYDIWTSKRIVIDTGAKTPDESFDDLLTAIQNFSV